MKYNIYVSGLCILDLSDCVYYMFFSKLNLSLSVLDLIQQYL